MGADHEEALEWAKEDALRNSEIDEGEFNLAAAYLERDAEVVELRRELETVRKAHDATKLNLETCWRKLEDERAAGATEAEVEAKTIERCAKVVEEGKVSGLRTIVDNIADAVRALQPLSCRAEYPALAPDGVGSPKLAAAPEYDEATIKARERIFADIHSFSSAADPVWTDEMLADIERLAESIRGKI